MIAPPEAPLGVTGWPRLLSRLERAALLATALFSMGAPTAAGAFSPRSSLRRILA